MSIVWSMFGLTVGGNKRREVAEATSLLLNLSGKRSHPARLEDEDEGNDYQDGADSDDYPDPYRGRSRSSRLCWWGGLGFSLEAEGSRPIAGRWFL